MKTCIKLFVLAAFVAGCNDSSTNPTPQAGGDFDAAKAAAAKMGPPPKVPKAKTKMMRM